MPYKNPEDKRAAGRRHYARHREDVIARVKARKWDVYGGTCLNCGGPTVGMGPGKAAPYCSKPACASAQRRPPPAVDS